MRQESGRSGVNPLRPGKVLRRDSRCRMRSHGDARNRARDDRRRDRRVDPRAGNWRQSSAPREAMQRTCPRRLGMTAESCLTSRGMVDWQRMGRGRTGRKVRGNRLTRHGLTGCKLTRCKRLASHRGLSDLLRREVLLPGSVLWMLVIQPGGDFGDFLRSNVGHAVAGFCWNSKD